MKKIILTITLLLMTFVSFTAVFGDTLAQESQFNNITVFIRFNDEQSYEAPFGYSYYDDMFNGIDQPSLKDYYLEASYGTLTIDSFIPAENENIIFYTDTFDRNYFEPITDENPNGVDEDGQAEREHNLIKRALDHVEEQNLIPDELNLDVNDDGVIDSLTFMISGEDTGWNTLLWPHKWELFTFLSTGDAPMINGVGAYYYTWELLGNSQNYDMQVDVGVLAHETFHLLGAPDLYHYYDYLDIAPVGSWGLMEYSGNIPSHMLGYMKEHYAGWITEVPEIYEGGTYTLYPLQENASNIYKIYTGVEDQWIYLEYRDDVGLYESNLPYSGLLVYRINMGIEGNDAGSYDDEGNPTDEVFIFRPGMEDITDPIVIVDGDVDGDIYRAALTDYSYYPDEMGVGTLTPIFLSDGTIINMGIYNVDEGDGFITFEVVLEPQIELVSDDYTLRGRNVMLYDSSLMDYNVRVTSIKPGQTAYYTLDGNDPDTTSDVYTPGSTFEIDSMNNQVKVAIYDGTELIQIIEKEYNFSTQIESQHNPYRNNLNLYYFLDFGQDSAFSIGFDNRSELEEDYDYITVDVDGTSEIFTGIDMRGYNQEFYLDEFLIHLETDEYVNSYYGFLVTLEMEEFITVELNGENEMTVPVHDTFTDPGAMLDGTAIENYTLEVVGEVNTDVIGTYTLTYIVTDVLDEIVLQDERTVHVVDEIAPVADLIGLDEIEIEVHTEYIDQYIIYSDNYDNNLTVEVDGEVYIDSIGTYKLTYTVTDQSGNFTSVERTVKVIDTTAPTGHILAGLDTIIKGEEWIDSGIDVIDNYNVYLDIDVIGEVDTANEGYFILHYEVADSSGNQLRLTRIVTVISEDIPEPEFTCSKMVTTISSEDQLVLLPCYVSGEETHIDKTDVEMTPGIHEILYFVEVDGIRFEHKVLYFVYDEGVVINEVAFIERRRKL